jgi:geranylgeranyl diphosphate synthase, type I
VIEPGHIPSELRAWRDAIEEGLRRAAPRREPLASLYQKVLANGRRFRPILVHAAHLACGGSAERVTGLAVAIELLHKASCVHDDLMDGDAFRRGIPAAFQTHGSAAAVVFGDYLVAAAWRELHQALVPFSSDVRQRCADELARVFVAMCEGQAEALVPGSGEDEVFWERAYAKTGSLIEGSLALGGLAAGVHEGEAPLPALRAIGRAAGIAFQLINDLNGLMGVEARGGKLPCGDAVRGERTWPIHLLERAMGADVSMAGMGRDPARMRDLLQRTGVAERVRAHVSELLADCRRHAAEIPHAGVRALVGLLAGSADSTYWSEIDAPVHP